MARAAARATAHPFSQHFSEAVVPVGNPPANRLLAATTAASWLCHLPDADASVKALAATLGITSTVVRERLRASLAKYVAIHWSDIGAVGVCNFSTPELVRASPDTSRPATAAVRVAEDVAARHSGASPATPCPTQRQLPLALVVHRVQEGIVAENFRVQARFRSLVHTDKQLNKQLNSGSGGNPSNELPSLVSAARDAWRWTWSCFPPPLRRCMPRLAPPAQLALAPGCRPRIVMLTGGMGAGKSTAIARLLQLEQFVVIEADQFKEPPALL